MKRYSGWIAALILLAAALLFCFFRGGQEGYVPPLHLAGDIETCMDTQDLEALGTVVKVELDGQTYRAVALSEIAERVTLCGSLERILFVAEDGFTAEISGSSMKDSYLSYTDEEGWRAVNPKHPISANAEFLDRIIFVTAADGNRETAVEISYGERSWKTTVGSLYGGQTAEYPYPEGEAEKGEYTSAVFTRRIGVTADILGVGSAEQLTLTLDSGETFSVSAESGFFQLCGNRLDYINAFSRAKKEGVRQITAE